MRIWTLILFLLLISKSQICSQNTFDQKLDSLDQMAEKFESDNRIVELIDINLKKIRLYDELTKYDQALQLALESKKTYCEDDQITKEFCGKCYALNNVIFEFMERIKNYDQCVHICKENLNSQCAGIGRKNSSSFKLASIYLEIGKKDSAIFYVLANHHNIINNGNTTLKEITHSLNNIGLTYSNIGEYENAIKYYKQLIDEINVKNDSLDIMYVTSGNIGYCYSKIGEIDSAYHYLKIDSKGSFTFKNKGSYINAETELANIEFQYFSPTLARKRLNKLLSGFEDQMTNIQKTRSLKLLIACYENEEAFEKANELYTELNELVEFDNQKKQEQIEIINRAYSTIMFNNINEIYSYQNEISQKQIALLEKNKEAQFQKLILIITLISSTFLIGLVLFLRYRTNQQSKLTIAEQELIIRETNEELLKLQVQANKKDINQLAIELKTKDDFSEKLTEKIKEIDGVSKQDVNQIKFFIKNELELKSTRSKLHEDISQINENFFSSIRIKHPNLNDGDLKLTAMIMLKQSNKQIALNKNITEGSVKVAKNRLKKKLNLDKDINLDDYLTQFID